MSDFEDDLSDAEVTKAEPAKKKGAPNVSTPVALGATLAVLLAGVGGWWLLNPPVAAPDPVMTQSVPVTPPTTTPSNTPIASGTPTPSTTAPTTTAPTTTTSTGVEAGSIPLIVDKPKAATTTTKPTASKPVIKPAPKPVAPRVVNPFAPLPKNAAGFTAVATIGSGNQGGPPIVRFSPAAQQTITVSNPTPTQTIRTPIVSSPFTPRAVTNTNLTTGGVGIASTIKPVPVVVMAQKPVLPNTNLVTSTPKPRLASTPIIASAPIARGSFSIAPTLLQTSPRVQPLQATTPATGTTPFSTTNPQSPATTATAATQTPTVNPTRPVTPEPPVFKIEPAPPTRPSSPTPATPTATPPTVTSPTTSTVPTSTITSPIVNPPVDNPPISNPSTPVTSTTPNSATAPTTPASSSTTPAPSNPVATTPIVVPATTEPAATTPAATEPAATTPAATPSADLTELRRVVQDDLRLEYAGFSIGTVKKAFFQSSRGLISVSEGEPLVRDSNVIVKSVSPTEVVLALGNELLTLPLVKR